VVYITKRVQREYSYLYHYRLLFFNGRIKKVRKTCTTRPSCSLVDVDKGELILGNYSRVDEEANSYWGKSNKNQKEKKKKSTRRAAVALTCVMSKRAMGDDWRRLWRRVSHACAYVRRSTQRAVVRPYVPRGDCTCSHST
jgi:hypothetical protein